MQKGGTEVKQAAEGVVSTKNYSSPTASFVQGMNLLLYVSEAASECKQRHSIYPYTYILREKNLCIKTKTNNKVTKCKKSNVITWLKLIENYMRILLTYKAYTWTLTAKHSPEGK